MNDFLFGHFCRTLVVPLVFALVAVSLSAPINGKKTSFVRHVTLAHVWTTYIQFQINP